MAITYHAGRRLQGLSTDVADTPTFETDFSSSTGWVSGNNTYFNIAGGTLNVKSDTNNIQTNMTYDLLANDAITVSSSWVMTFKLVIASPYSVNTNSGHQHRCYIGLSDSTTVGEPASIDELMFTICARSDVNKHEVFNNNNGSTQYVALSPTVTVTPSTKYVKLIRNENTSLTAYIYSDENFSTLLGSASANNNLSSITGTKYIKVSQFVQNNAGVLNFTLDDLKFYNGVSSLTNKPTNVQVGSRFEETDTRKIYHSSTVHTFLLADTGTNFTPTESGTVEYLVIGGGGRGGGGTYNGGGGAGAYRTDTDFPVTAQTYAITVGAGGTGIISGYGGTGGSSIFDTITSEGGSGGAGSHTNAGGTGTTGSGGGGAIGNGAGGAGGIYGNNGGSGFAWTSPYATGGGGGGGAGSAGSNGVYGAGGAGGAGLSSSITGSAIIRAGGGGGSAGGNRSANVIGSGGSGGGGDGGHNSSPPDTLGIAGTANTGSGSGGGNGYGVTGDGGSGIVIIKYTSGVKATGGTITTVWTEEA